jgi:hypothetical protein
LTAFTKTVYLVLGALSLIAGVVVLVAPGVLLPPAELTPLTSHLLREEASAFVFIGLMFFWCLTHYEQRRTVHLALLVFIILFAGVHWVDYLQAGEDIVSPLINTIPVALIAATTPFSRRS